MGRSIGSFLGLLPLAARRRRRLVREAIAFREKGEWRLAARAYAQALELGPATPSLTVQFGHAQKEAGDLAAAIGAYTMAAAMRPADVDVRVHLAALLRREGKVVEAARVYAAILALDPDHAQAALALRELGERRLTPPQILARGELSRRLERLAGVLGGSDVAVDGLVAGGAFPLVLFDDFRHAYPVPPPPSRSRNTGVVVLVLATAASAAMLHATLTSLLDQTAPFTAAIVVAPDDLAAHPVASLAAQDSRVTFVAPGSAIALPAPERMMVIAAGTMLDPIATEWFVFAADRSDADAVYGDHDTAEEDWRRGRLHASPALFGAHDPLVLAVTDDVPPAALAAAVLVRAILPTIAQADPVEVIRTILLSARRGVHVPRFLASIYRPPLTAQMAPVPARVLERASTGGVLEQQEHPHRGDVSKEAAGAGAERIAVIVPTHDNATMLTACVDSLRCHAAYPGSLDVIVLDHRTNRPDDKEALKRLALDGVRVLPFDEPFNWSRANNIGAASCDTPLLVFMNDDMRMTTAAWDDEVRRRLRDPETGALGARLLYPDGGYQHSGILFGTSRDGLTVHEGIGSPGVADGPARRWRTTRKVAAVTGAFLAVRAGAHRAIGGFDEQLAIAYNDLDYCFRLREAGLDVLYGAAITLVHHESATRGRNRTGDQIAWDEAEQAVLGRRWGKALLYDPAYNPQWARDGVPFDGLREPPQSDILRHLPLSADGGDAWSVRRIKSEA